jgi:glycerol kinase
MTDDAESYEALALDLTRRTERTVERFARLAVDTGVTFQVADIVQAVEDDLPADYPAPTRGPATRVDLITQVVRDVLSGEAFQQ